MNTMNITNHIASADRRFLGAFRLIRNSARAALATFAFAFAAAPVAFAQSAPVFTTPVAGAQLTGTVGTPISAKIIIDTLCSWRKK
jgi:hypothetical protein